MSSLRPVRGTAREIHALLAEWESGTAEPPALSVETSGSTGEPKRVLLSRSAMRASATATADRLGGPGQWLLTLPPSYVAGLQVLFRSVLAGTSPVLLADHDDLPSAVASMAGPRRYVSLVPTQLARLLAAPETADALRRFDAVLVGGAGLDPGLRGSAASAGVRVVSTYGMSETCGGCVYDGLALDRVAVAIGADGRVRVGGPVLFDGYDGRPDLTAEVLRDGWFLTSDLGRLDEDGRLEVVGRVDDVVISGGVNVPGPAVAARLRAHPAVAAAEVVGIPDAEWGSRVVAVVVPAGAAPSLDELRSFVAEVHPRAWAPRNVVVVDGLPLLPNGKVDRRAVEAIACGAEQAPTRPERAPTRPERAPTQPERAPTRRGRGVSVEVSGLERVVFSVPMTTRFRGITVREGMLLRGPAGWGEFSPFLEYDAQVAAPWLACALEAARTGWPEPVRDRVPVNVTVPAVGPERAQDIVRAGGCGTAKVKVAEPGQSLAEAEERLRAVRDALGPSGRIRVDANGAWSVDEAVVAVRALDRAAGGLEYVEQPCRDVEELALVRRRVEVPVAADESIRRAADPYRVRDLEAADVAVLKVQPLGGVRACLRIAEDIGLPVVVSSALETSVGIAAGVALAAALPELPFACGLATVQLLTDDVVESPLVPRDGELPVVRPAVDPSAVRRLRADEDRTAVWEARLAAVGALGQDRVS